jgi:RNA polymerase sigma-70 factor (ECF subfamily)
MSPAAEPDEAGKRVMSVGTDWATDGSFDDFYAAAYPRLVRTLTAISGSRADAEEVVQEAFVRLLPRWRRIQRYDQPEAWVRRVAVRQVLSRKRHRRVAVAAQHLLAEELLRPGPNGDRLDVRDVIRGLPVDQRTVLVLHHGLDLSLEQIADDIGAPLGTVKSRLHRARAAFAMHYDSEVPSND